MKTHLGRKILSLLCLLLAGAALHAAAPWSGPLMQRGIAAASCAAPAEDNFGTPLPAATEFTFGLVDLRNPAATNYGACGPAAPLWYAPMYHHPTWNAEDLGNVFGITLDTSGNMFVAAHGLYGIYRPLHHRYGNIGGGSNSLSAAGTVYRIDVNTGVVTVFAVIPGQQAMSLAPGFTSGPGLGNLAYDKLNNQFFVSSLEDGKIYRVSSAGAVINSFDPLTPDNGAAGMPPRTERVWAVEVLNNEVFYSIWNNGDSTLPGVIRKVSLNGSGDFIPSSDTNVLTVPAQSYVYSGGTPVSDITFSLDGQTMIIGERTMFSDTDAYNHASATHMANLIGSTWTVTRTLRTGCNVPQGESYGGVAFGEEAGVQEAIVWSSSADTAVNFGPHGLYGVRTSDFPTNAQALNSFKAPYLPNFQDTWYNDRKGSGGDVEIMREAAGCAEIRASTINCPESNGAPFTVTLSIQNLTTNTIHYIWMTPCPTSSLPAGAITAQPQPDGIVMLPTPLAPGSNTTITVTLPAQVNGQTVCFRVTMLDKSGNQCCTTKVCITMPPCDCAEIIGREITCEPQADGTVKYNITLTIRNLTHLSGNPYPIPYVSILPPTGFSPTFAIPTPNPIPVGGTGTVTLCYFGTPGPICFNLGLHDETLELCCSPKEICLDLPPCPPASDKPDTCSMETKVPCCPPAPGLATINYTICNNSTVPRTYTWNASGIAAPGCTKMLTASSFFPSSGTIGPIPPGGCMTVPINVRCEGFLPGDCAGFRICASYNAAVPPLCCEGTIYRPKQGEPVVKHVRVGGSGVEVPPDGSAPLVLEVENPTDAAMSVDLLLDDVSGVLTFNLAGQPGGASPFFTTRVVLQATQLVEVTFDTRRIDHGAFPLDFTSVNIFADIVGAPRSEPDLNLPVRLLRDPVTGGLPVVKSVSVEQTPVPRIVITFPTKAGSLYRIEQATELGAAWTPSECTTPDTSITPEGNIVGTGSDVTCYVLCDPAADKMFFRVAEQR